MQPGLVLRERHLSRLPLVGAVSAPAQGGRAFGPVATRLGSPRAVMPTDLAARAYHGSPSSLILRASLIILTRFVLPFVRVRPRFSILPSHPAASPAKG